MLRTRMRLAGAVIIAALLLALVQGAAAQDGPDAIPEVHLRDAAWSPDSQLLAVAGNWGVKVFDVGLQEIAHLTDHTGPALSVTWSPDGRQLASAGGEGDATVRIWDRNPATNTFSLRATLPTTYEWLSIVAWSPDGASLAVLGEKWVQGILDPWGTVEIWDTATWQVAQTLPGPFLPHLEILAWNADGTQLASGGTLSSITEGCAICPHGQRVSIYYIADAQTGEIMHVFGRYDQYGTLAWRGDRLAVTGLPGQLAVYDTTYDLTELPLTGWVNFNKNHILLSISPDEQILVAVGGGTIDLLDTATGTVLIENFAPAEGITVLDWSPDGQYLAMLEYDDEAIVLQDMSAFVQVPPVASAGPDQTVTDADSSGSEVGASLRELLSDPDCQAACFLGIEPGVTTNAGVEAILTQANIEYDISAIGFFSNNRSYTFDASILSSHFYNDLWQGFIWAGEHENDVVTFIILPLNGISVGSILSSYGPPVRISFSGRIKLVYPNERLVFEVDLDPSMISSVEITTLDTLTVGYMEQDSLLPCTEPIEICSIITTNHPTAAAGPDQTVTDADSSGSEVVTLDGSASSVQAQGFPDTFVSWNPDGTMLAVANGTTVQIQDVATRQLLNAFTGLQEQDTAPAWNPDGTRLAIANGSEVQIWQQPWNTSGAQLIAAFQSVPYISSMAWSPGGDRIAVVEDPLEVWDVSTAQRLYREYEHGNFILQVAWSPDGTQLATASVDKTVKIWDAATGAVLSTMRVMTDTTTMPLSQAFVAATSVAWSPDGTKLVHGAGDGSVRIWDREILNGIEVALAWVNPNVLQGHDDSVWAVAWSPDGSQIASGSLDGTVRIWDATTHEELRVIQVGTPVGSVAWSPNGSQLAYSGSENAVEIVPAPAYAPPVAAAGPDQTVTDADSSGSDEIVITVTP